MRVSEAALALVTRINARGETEYLTQWNQAWQAYSLIGGHVEAGETFRECCVREIEEELQCQISDINVDGMPVASLRFHEFSRAAATETEYRWDLFAATLTDRALSNIPPDCTWVSETLAINGSTFEGRRIAAQVRRVFAAICNIKIQ